MCWPEAEGLLITGLCNLCMSITVDPVTAVSLVKTAPSQGFAAKKTKFSSENVSAESVLISMGPYGAWPKLPIQVEILPLNV